MTATSAEGLKPQSLDELTGRRIDTTGLYARIAPRLETSQANLHTHIINELARYSDITEKVARYGERTPIAPHLSEITCRLEQALYFSDPMMVSDEELLVLYGHWIYEVKEARDFFDE